MTRPSPLVPETTAASTFRMPDDAGVASLDIPGDVYLVRSAKGRRETLVTQYDLTEADSVVGNDVTPSWSDPDVLVEAYRLGPLVDTCEQMLRALFGDSSSIRPGIERDPDSAAPSLVLWLDVPRSERHLRHEFLSRYARETIIPGGAPVPVLLWEYHDAVHS